MGNTLRNLRRSSWWAWLLCSLLLGLNIQLFVGVATANPLFSYRDEQGTNVITDNYASIPAKYHAKVVIVEQDADQANQSLGMTQGVGGFLNTLDRAVGSTTISMPGMSQYQSHALTVTGVLALLCFALRQFSSSQVTRFLTLWVLIMLGIITPALVFLSQDGPLDRLRGQASNIQTKQLDHLKHAQ